MSKKQETKTIKIQVRDLNDNLCNERDINEEVVNELKERDEENKHLKKCVRI